jgi:hypothetical protein
MKFAILTNPNNALSTTRRIAMKFKGVCPECNEVVACKALVFAIDCGVERDPKDDATPFVLCAQHEVKEGYRADSVVSIPSGKTVEVFCRGSMRPPKELMQVH